MKVFGADPNYNQARVDDLKKRDQAAAVKAARSDAPAAEAGKSSSTATNVAVSGFAKEVAKANTAVKNTPDVRKEKVDAIKEKISKGEYHVDSEKIAGKIVADMVKQGK
ncbi:MAG: flagellar biosynthesis anti-sigma factor FlgM [Nitrospinae bacterium]|nr:flagellar biosynthesis anti-sigma factor FlgM [Nitrospinota bacterium]